MLDPPFLFEYGELNKNQSLKIGLENPTLNLVVPNPSFLDRFDSIESNI
jgi:hypothetical protein